MRYIRTNHNPLTVSDILLKNGTARLEDFYPVLSRFSCFDKNIHLKGSLISVAQSYFCRT